MTGRFTIVLLIKILSKLFMMCTISCATLCSSRGYPCPPWQRRLTEIPRERVVSNVFKGKYNAELEFLEGWCVDGEGGGGFKLKKPSMSDGAGRFVEHKKACNVIDAQGTLRAILASCVLFKLPKCICCITLIGPLQLGS